MSLTLKYNWFCINTFKNLFKKRYTLDEESVPPVPVEEGLGQVVNHDGSFNIMDKVLLYLHQSLKIFFPILEKCQLHLVSKFLWARGLGHGDGINNSKEQASERQMEIRHQLAIWDEASISE